MLTVHIQKTNEGHGSSGIGIHAGFHLQKEAHIARKTGVVKTAIVSSKANKHSHQYISQILVDKSDRFQETATTKPGLDKRRGWKLQTSLMSLT